MFVCGGNCDKLHLTHTVLRLQWRTNFPVCQMNKGILILIHTGVFLRIPQEQASAGTRTTFTSHRNLYSS